MPKSKAKNQNNDTKTYILTLQNNEIRKVVVPKNWKLTFGPTIPYSGKNGVVSGTALRFYEGSKENLRACFTDVKAFRDADIPVQERRTQTQRKVVQRDAPGGAKNVEIVAQVTEWFNPDDSEDSAESAKPFLNLIANSDGA